MQNIPKDSRLEERLGNVAETRRLVNENMKTSSDGEKSNGGDSAATDRKLEGSESKSLSQNPSGPTGGGTRKKSVRCVWMAILAVVLVALTLAMCVKGINRNSVVLDTVVVNTDVTKEYVEDSLVTIASGPENMRCYSYTGEWANGLPNGKGYAYFDSWGDCPGATYEGRFVDGVCDDNTGDAVLNIFCGDQYSGIFKEGYCETGCFSLENGNYFEGTFQKGEPFNGKWICSDGTILSDVVNGKETPIVPKVPR